LTTTTDIAMDAISALDRIIADASGGDLSFQTHADVAVRVRMALDEPNQHLDTAAKAVQAEPLLSARVVALANSVVFNRSGQQVTDVRHAVSRLGFKLVRALATAVVMRQMSGAQGSPAQRAMAEQLWEHTAHMAALCYVLAKRVSRQDPDIAMFAGIVHEVGAFYLVSRLGDYPQLLDDCLYGVWADGGEARLGRAVLTSLAVPIEVSEAIASLWQGEPVVPPISLGDTLTLADRLTPILSPLVANEDGSRPEDMAGRLADSELAAILEASVDELESLTTALRF
jgi:HD-like signal output (HDOD) protein